MNFTRQSRKRSTLILIFRIIRRQYKLQMCSRQGMVNQHMANQPGAISKAQHLGTSCGKWRF